MTGYLLYLAWVVSLTATFGSMYFSEWMDLTPCSLCWYQRIFMFPLTVILGVASYRNDQKIAPYALSLSIIGSGIALIHVVMQSIPSAVSIIPCSDGTDCSKVDAVWFGFITIPLLSLCAFVLISVLLIFMMKKESYNID